MPVKKIQNLSLLVKIRSELRPAGKIVVFTNGCFDVLHAGHVHLLQAAKKKGDVLMVGVNDDASIKLFKESTRPVFPVEERLEILAGMECVDYALSFSEETPLKLISALLPDVLVKGGDWKPEDVVGRHLVEAAGGRVVIVPYLPGHSSSEIIKKILA